MTVAHHHQRRTSRSFLSSLFKEIASLHFTSSHHPSAVTSSAEKRFVEHLLSNVHSVHPLSDGPQREALLDPFPFSSSSPLLLDLIFTHLEGSVRHIQPRSVGYIGQLSRLASPTSRLHIFNYHPMVLKFADNCKQTLIRLCGEPCG